MSALSLTLPDGTVFAASGGIQATYGTTTNWLVGNSGLISQVFTAFNSSGGSDGRTNGRTQSIRLGSGAGVHSITLQFNDWQGNTDEWGDAAANDPPLTKLQTLDFELNSQRISGDNPITFEHGEYATGGKYDPLDVVVDEAQLFVDNKDSPSVHTPQLTLIDVVDLRETIDALQRTA